MECPHGLMHINSAGVHVEVHRPDENGVGELLVTQLNNLAFPFIRYRIGDVGSVGEEPCACGRHLPVLGNLRGRVCDYIVTPDGTLIHGEWFTHLFYNVAGVALFTFRQIGAEEYVFEVQRDAGFDTVSFNNAVDKARGKLGSSSSIGIRFVESFAVSTSGKHRFVINEYAASRSEV